MQIIQSKIHNLLKKTDWPFFQHSKQPRCITHSHSSKTIVLSFCFFFFGILGIMLFSLIDMLSSVIIHQMLSLFVLFVSQFRLLDFISIFINRYMYRYICYSHRLIIHFIIYLFKHFKIICKFQK